MGAAVSVSPGDVIGGTYVIERLLGQGGMGAVFVASEERLGRRVAIKVLLSDVAGNAEAVARFEREARSAAALQSDHVTRVLSVGHLPNGAPYIVMELLEGEDLATMLEKRGALQPHEVVSYMLQVCEALTEAHALGIVHRDLKPANIFLARRPTGAMTVKVLDFGISKGATAAASQSPLTRTTAVMGTPMYMSPEQLREARNVDGRADIWALGIVMYELLCGRPPFEAEALAELCVYILTTEPEPLPRRRADVPPALAGVVARCLRKDASERFASARELMMALTAAASAPAPAPAPAPARPPEPRMATPRMNPNPLGGLATEAIEARARGEAPTEVRGETPAYSPMYPPQQPRQLPVAAATVDPVSNTAWEPPRRPGVLGILLAFAAALSLGGGALYFVFLRPSALVATSAASGSSASSGAATSEAAGAALVPPPASGGPVAASAPSVVLTPLGSSSALASASSAAASSARASGSRRNTQGGPVAPPFAAAGPAPPTLAAPALPPPGARLEPAPVVSSRAAPPPPPAGPRPSPPSSGPGSLMPGERN